MPKRTICEQTEFIAAGDCLVLLEVMGMRARLSRNDRLRQAKSSSINPGAPRAANKPIVQFERPARGYRETRRAAYLETSWFLFGITAERNI
jgi:hypothetical protein